MRNSQKQQEIKSVIKKIFVSKYFSLVIGLIFLLITFFVWKTTETDDVTNLSENVDSIARIYSGKVESRIRNIEFSLNEFASHGSPNTLEEENEWDSDADFYIQNLGGIRNLVWVDRDLSIRRVAPIENSEYIIGTNINSFRNDCACTNIMIPIYNDDIIDGFLIGNVDIPSLMLTIDLDVDFEQNYMIQVYEGDELLGTSANWEQTTSGISEEKDISFNNKTFSFVLSPTKATVFQSKSNSYLILVFGLFLSGLISMIWYSRTVSNIRLEGLVDEKTKELRHLSYHDQLTGLNNRHYYFEQFKLLDKPEYYPIGVIMIDVNGLKIINDAFGHAVGDVALKMLGNVLKESSKEGDIISRIGGDEFAALLTNTNREKLQDFKDQIIAKVKTLRVENVELSLAVGYELKNNIDENIDDIQKLAENHMYRHKTTEGSSVRSKAINAILETLTDKYTIEREHSHRVSQLSKLIGKELHLMREDEIKGLEQSALFHDIGKISIPDEILKKPGKLTYEEYEIIKSHTEVGYQILRAADEFSDLAIHALYHHEHWDGSGYPKGLKGKNIPLYSRIICVADAYDSMTADRPYRKKMSEEYAISEIRKYAGTQFDPAIAKVFIEKVLTN